MKKFMILAAAGLLAGCGYVSPDAGQEAVLVKKPWFFGSGGVVSTPVKTGSQIVAASTDAVYINVTPRAFENKFDDLMPSDGIPLDFVTTVRVQILNSPVLVEKWGAGEKDQNGNLTDNWYWRNINPQYENFVRNAVKKYTMNDLALSGAAIDKVDNEIQQNLEKYIKETGIPVRLLGVTVGRANPPEEIKNQRVETAAQQQREKTMIEQKKAEDSRKAAENSRAEADNAYRNGMNLTPEQFVDLQRIEMTKEVCAKGGCTFIQGNASAIVGK